MSELRLSVVVVSYNMRRELPRTIRTLSPAMQEDLRPEDYEIIVIDNGSTQPCERIDFSGFDSNLRLLHMEHPNAAPARAVNIGIAAARSDFICVMIDGARMASPGLLAGALRAARLHPRTVVATLGFHLGPEVQMASVHAGYTQEVEDRLLRDLGWEQDGYRLFDASVFAGSSAGGWFAPIAESNALFMSRELWAELGSFDERFVEPGGGLVNLDTYRRACALPDSELVVLLGEGTFHQVHGGVATNAAVSPWERFHDEYLRLRGEPFSAPRREPVLLGTVRKPVLASITHSARHENAANWEPRPTKNSALGKKPDVPHELCALSGSALLHIQRGVMETRYRGKLFLKSPFDVVLYLQLIQALRPRTVIEIGTKEGGSALWFADTIGAHGIDVKVLSVDRCPPSAIIDPRITFIRGDARDLAPSLPEAVMCALPHPILVVEDSAHEYEASLAVLEFFNHYLDPGDYIVIEDGVVRFLPGEEYAAYEDGPLRAVREFMETHPREYAIDRHLCDFFGTNVTYNPSGYLRRILGDATDRGRDRNER